MSSFSEFYGSNQFCHSLLCSLSLALCFYIPLNSPEYHDWVCRWSVQALDISFTLSFWLCVIFPILSMCKLQFCWEFLVLETITARQKVQSDYMWIFFSSSVEKKLLYDSNCTIIEIDIRVKLAYRLYDLNVGHNLARSSPRLGWRFHEIFRDLRGQETLTAL